MGFLDSFKKEKEKKESELINFLYEKADKLNGEQLTELLRYTFLIFGNSGAGFILIGLLVQKINVHINCDFLPRSREDFKKWLDEVFLKIDLERKRAIFVTAAFDVYQHNVISGAGLMQKIDDAIKELEKTPEFQKLRGLNG